MRDYVIMTDSCCDMTAQAARDLDLVVLPLSLEMGEHVYRNWPDGRDIGFEDFYARIRGGETATTSAANVGEFEAEMRKILEQGKDILDPSNWKKTNYPILTSRSVPGEYGTGHNAYVEDENGDVWNTYHARPGVDAPRCSGIRQVHFDVDGQPVLDMTEEMAVSRAISRVETTLVVK